MLPHPTPTPPGPGQESCWDYPRPPRLETSTKHVKVIVGDTVLGATSKALRVLETSHPPVWYLPMTDVRMEHLELIEGQRTFCEFKGFCRYWNLAMGEDRRPGVAFSYEQLVPDFGAMKDHIGFYAGRVDACFVDGERVRPQEGDYYAGWITGDVVGPFKGPPGTRFW